MYDYHSAFGLLTLSKLILYCTEDDRAKWRGADLGKYARTCMRAYRLAQGVGFQDNKQRLSLDDMFAVVTRSKQEELEVGLCTTAA